MRLPRKREISNSGILTRAASLGRVTLHGEAQRLRSVRRVGDRRADSHGRVGRAALRPRDVRPKAEPRKNKSQGGHPAPRRDATPNRSPARALKALDIDGPVLVIGPNAAMRVRGGALDVEQGFSKDRVRVRIDVDLAHSYRLAGQEFAEGVEQDGVRLLIRARKARRKRSRVRLRKPN